MCQPGMTIYERPCMKCYDVATLTRMDRMQEETTRDAEILAAVRRSPQLRKELRKLLLARKKKNP